MIGAIEAAIAEHAPTTVAAPVPSYNQDHRTVYEAFRTATRHHDRNRFVPRCLLYEEPDNYLQPVHPFNPAYFRPLDIERKLTANDLHRSQRRGHRSPHVLRTMATHRGLQAGLPAAEAFEVYRWIDTPPTTATQAVEPA
jgi:hypothetical protein